MKPTMVNDIRLNYFSTDSDNSSIALNNNYAALVGLGSAGLPATCLPGVIPGLITDQASSVAQLWQQDRDGKLHS